ncbi:MAG: hypothetical protein AAFQ98_09555, partial [Bacteroidota bacterium]
ENRLTDEAISKGQKLRGWEKVLLWIGWPLFLLSRPFTAWPKRIGKWYVEKRKLWGTQWYLSIYYGFEWILYSITFILSVIVVFSTLGTLWGWLSIPTIILATIYGERYSFLAYRSIQNGRWKRFKKKNVPLAEEIVRLREDIAALSSGQ